MPPLADYLVNRQTRRAKHRAQRIEVALEDRAIPLEGALARVETVPPGSRRPAHLEAGLDALVDGLRGAAPGLERQDEVAEAGGIKAVANDIEGGQLLSNEEHFLPSARAEAIRLTMVCDLPELGGPSIARFF